MRSRNYYIDVGLDGNPAFIPISRTSDGYLDVGREGAAFEIFKVLILNPGPRSGHELGAEALQLSDDFHDMCLIDRIERIRKEIELLEEQAVIFSKEETEVGRIEFSRLKKKLSEATEDLDALILEILPSTGEGEIT